MDLWSREKFSAYLESLMPADLKPEMPFHDMVWLCSYIALLCWGLSVVSHVDLFDVSIIKTKLNHESDILSNIN